MPDLDALAFNDGLVLLADFHVSPPLAFLCYGFGNASEQAPGRDDLAEW